jgi:hypothetical protein
LQKNILKERKKIFLFLSLLLIFGLFLTGCNWFENGIINVFDPQAQLRVLSVEYTDESKTTLNVEVASINQVEFNGSGFRLLYYNNGSRVTSLDTAGSGTFYVYPADTPGEPGTATEITGITLYTGEVLNYVKNNKAFNQITCDVYLKGTDGAGHDLELKIIENVSALGIDSENPEAKITIDPQEGQCPLMVTFDGSDSTDSGFGIASYNWQLPQLQSGTISTSSVFSQNFSCDFLTDSEEVVSVILTVTDYHGNQDSAAESFTISLPESASTNGCGS